MKKILLTGVLLMPIFSFAAPSVEIRNYGVPDCGEWIKQNSNAQKAWLLGFLSGLNVNEATHQNPLGRLQSADQAFLWVDNFCRQNPLKNVFEGGYRLLDELNDSKKKRFAD